MSESSQTAQTAVDVIKAWEERQAPGGHDVTASAPGGAGGLATVIEARSSAVELRSWLPANRSFVAEILLDCGAVLFRGFGVDDAERFSGVTRALDAPLLDYTYRSTARSEQADRIFTSTEYPPAQEILLHNENSYARRWPVRLWFCCVAPATEGGSTPLADSRVVFDRVDATLRRRLAETGVLYVRNYSDFVDLPWPEVFQTSDPRQVERYCDEAGIAFEWRPDGGLTTRQVAQAVARHPISGAPVWFNQAHLFHPSGLPESLREALLDLISEDELPRQAFYGDGAPFDPRELEHIRDVYRDTAVDFAWQAGDVLLVDNMLVAHGRRSFVGPRKVLVAMSGHSAIQDGGVEDIT